MFPTARTCDARWLTFSQRVFSVPSMEADRLLDLYQCLLTAYGPQNWWPAEDPFEVIVGAILTQRTAWRNVEGAIRALRAAGMLTIEAMNDAPLARIAELVRPAVFYNEKARRLKAFAGRVVDRYEGELARLLGQPAVALREELLAVYGIGPETADAIVLYAAKKPSFVIDAYTRRLLQRLDWIRGNESYAALRTRVMDFLPHDVALFNEYHALIVRHGAERCRVMPICEGCPIGSRCTFSGAGC